MQSIPTDGTGITMVNSHCPLNSYIPVPRGCFKAGRISLRIALLVSFSAVRYLPVGPRRVDDGLLKSGVVLLKTEGFYKLPIWMPGQLYWPRRPRFGIRLGICGRHIQLQGVEIRARVALH